MEKFYQDRFLAQRRLARATAELLEVNHILEKVRAEIRQIIPECMEACILLIDPQASKYTHPLQCGLFEGPVNCISCKRQRPAVQKALKTRKGVAVHQSPEVVRPDGTVVQVGPEIAMPAFAEGELVAIISAVLAPGTQMTRKEFLIGRDTAETVGQIIVRAKKYREVTQEKIRMTNILGHLKPFVPTSVRRIVEDNPESPHLERREQDVSVLFLDLEGYTELFEDLPREEIGRIIERLFSAFIDPIHRFGGDINETAGDGLMIIFSGRDPEENAANAVSAAQDLQSQIPGLTAELGPGYPPLIVNMGLSSGLALLGMARFEGVSQTRTTYTATGQVTNLAARLAAKAHGGDILLGPLTRERIGDSWPAFDQGEMEIKGLTKPVRVFSMCHPHSGDESCRHDFND